MALVASGLSYRPDAWRLFLPGTVPSAADSSLARYVHERVPERGTALFFRSSTYLYWISHRYPPVPYLNLDVQTVHSLSSDPRTLLTAPGRDDLFLIEFDPVSPGVQANDYRANAELLHTLVMFGDSVAKYFEADSTSPVPYSFWTRRQSPLPTDRAVSAARGAVARGLAAR